jgi:hypothetical protein
MNIKTNKEIKDIDFKIYKLKVLFNKISLKINKTDQDEKDLKMFKKSINSLNQKKKGLNNEL